MKKKVFEHLSLDELIALDLGAFKNNNKSRMTLVQIGRRFIEHALGLDLFKVDFSQVRLNFINESGKQDVTEDEDQFYKYIASYYLSLDKEPITIVLKLFHKASDDLKKIDNQLKLINAHLKTLEEKKKASRFLNGEERYDRNLYEHYRDKNQHAKDEILKFITEHLEAYALSNCRSQNTTFSVIGAFTGSMPYSYSRGMMFSYFDPFDVEQMTVMSNKFLNFTVQSHSEIKELYNNDKEQFYIFAKEYISGELEGVGCGLDILEECFLTSHIISKRRDVISAILRHYKNADYISVVNMLPMQIEGIFHDICSEMGIDESRLDLASINEKLRMLKDSMLSIYFEYYSFKFPVIRNTVAHGKVVKADIEREAIMLILDLLPVCEMAVSDKVPVIRKIKLLKKVLKDDFGSLIEYVDLKGVIIPDFYNLADDILTADSKLSSEEFWNYLRNEIKKGSVENINDSKVVKFVRHLHGQKICTEIAGKFLKDLPIVIGEIKAQAAESKKMLEKFTQNYKKNPK